MGELKIKLPDQIERLFRRIAMKRFGYQKGAMSEAAKEAISTWAASQEEMKKEELWDDLRGVMKNVEKSSVELQHEIGRILTKKHAHRR